MANIINETNDDASMYIFPPASEATEDSISKTTATAAAGVSLPNAPSVNNLERLINNDDDEEAKKIIVSEEAKMIVKESDDFFDDAKKPKESDDTFNPESSDSAAIICLKHDDEDNVRLWAGNFSIYWLLGTLIGLWFIFIHTPQHIIAKGVQDFGAVFWMHITLACFTYVACMWNVFHTPSHGPWYANIHILVGRTAVCTSLLGFSLGMVAAWGPGSVAPFGLAIGLTSGGIGQILCTIVGFSAIKLHQWEKEKPVPDEERKQMYLRIHIGTMLGLFLPSCGTPAVMRLFYMVGMKLQVGLPVGITIFVIMIPLAERALDKKRWY